MKLSKALINLNIDEYMKEDKETLAMYSYKITQYARQSKNKRKKLEETILSLRAEIEHYKKEIIEYEKISRKMEENNR